MPDEPFKNHQADERLAQTDTIAKKGTVVLPRDFQEGSVAFTLIAVEIFPNARFGALPVARAKFTPLEILRQRLRVDIEWGILANVAFYRSQYCIGDIFTVCPVLLVPFLKNANGLPSDLDVEFDILGDAGLSKIG